MCDIDLRQYSSNTANIADNFDIAHRVHLKIDAINYIG